MSTPTRSTMATPSPNKRLRPVVEVPVQASRSSEKRTSVAHTSGSQTPAGSPDAKRQRREDSITFNMIRDESPSSRTTPRGNKISLGSWESLEMQARAAPRSPTKQPIAPIASTSKKPFTLPGQEKANKRKLERMSGLLAPGPSTSSKDIDLGFGDDQETGIEGKKQERIARDTPSSSKSASVLAKKHEDIAKRVQDAPLAGVNSDDSGMDVDPPPSPSTGITASTHRLPSPAPTSSTASKSQLPPATEPTQTPTKPRRPTHLATPTGSSKKRTPTKAVKQKEAEAGSDFLSAPTSTLNLFPTPSTTPDRSPRPSNSYPSRDILTILQRVLEQLSSPCAAIPASSYLKPTDPAYRSWLASQACLSPAHAAAEKDVRNTLDRTIRDGEGNCMLIIGERGIGKSAIVERSLKTLEGVYGKDAFLTVKLSGLVQRDDKAAVREIARQLCSSSYSEEVEEGSTFNSNANILSSLLAILEPGQSDDPEEAANKAKPLIFIIDEFDLFAHSAVRQSMLYCLLDCVQGGFRRGGMAVFGLSARADCFESLEKRVKSRCQSRVHHILPAEVVQTGMPARAKQAMLMREARTEIEQEWNENVETFFADKTVQLQLEAMNDLRGLDADRRLFDILTLITARRVKRLATAEATSSTTLPALRPSDLSAHIQLAERAIPSSLNMVEFALMIACKHLTEEEKPVNFVIAYERYVDHCKRAAASGSSSSRAFSRGLCLRAFESLKKLGLVKEVAAPGKQQLGGGSIFRLCRLVPWPFMIEEAVKNRKDIPQHLAKWCKAWSD